MPPRDPDRSTPVNPRPAVRPVYIPPRPSPHGGRPPEDNDREVLLRAMAEMEVRFEDRLAQARRASMVPKTHNWGDLATKAVAALSLIAGVVSVVKPTKDERVAPAYEEFNKALISIQARQDRTDASLEGLRAWLDGFLATTGVKVTRNAASPPPLRVELQPAPLVADDVITPDQAPAIQVKTPIPPPPPSSAPIKLRPLPRE